MAASSTVTNISVGRTEAGAAPRHSLLVRVTHWLTTIAFIALLITGGEIVISHPRFYWGETGNSGTTPWLNLHIPSSRDTVPTGYGYTMPDQNGWSRYLHFEAAWLLVIVALVYGIASVLNGHFRRDLWPRAGERGWSAVRDVFGRYLRRAPDIEGAHAYNVVQRISYLGVIFVLFPFVIWTGLALSPGFNAAFPWFVDVLGGRQSARTLHFLDSIALTLFLIVHVGMVAWAGFWSRTVAMITGRAKAHIKSGEGL